MFRTPFLQIGFETAHITPKKDYSTYDHHLLFLERDQSTFYETGYWSKYGLRLKSGGVLNSPLAKPSVLWALMTWFPKTLTYDMLPVRLTFFRQIVTSF